MAASSHLDAGIGKPPWDSISVPENRQLADQLCRSLTEGIRDNATISMKTCFPKAASYRTNLPQCFPRSTPNNPQLATQPKGSINEQTKTIVEICTKAADQTHN